MSRRSTRSLPAAAGVSTARDQLCLKFPDEDESCFAVAVTGRRVTYIHDVDDEEEFDLHDGNPRKL